jgi:hypothetical protein
MKKFNFNTAKYNKAVNMFKTNNLELWDAVANEEAWRDSIAVALQVSVFKRSLAAAKKAVKEEIELKNYAANLDLSVYELDYVEQN